MTIPTLREAVATAFRPRIWRLAHGRTLTVGPRGLLMAIINVTPDSFSDGGRFDNVAEAVDAAGNALALGATIIDIGGESTRPGGETVDAGTEQARVLPVIEAIAAESEAIISVDTYRAETARLAVDGGAHIVNDVWGLQKDRGIASVAADTGAGVCIMHTGRGREKLDDVVDDQFWFLRRSLEVARDAGIDDTAIVLDPGFGFAKNPDENMQLIARFPELHDIGFPLLVGASRKRFLGAVTGRETAGDRDIATAATTALLRMQGAAIFRVHDVAASRDALSVADAVLLASNLED
ncbi:dihydropteroate synthase [Flavimaribacter sediminis]